MTDHLYKLFVHEVSQYTKYYESMSPKTLLSKNVINNHMTFRKDTEFCK